MVQSRSSAFKTLWTLIIVCFVFSMSTGAIAQKVIESTGPETRLKWYDQHVTMKDVSLFKNLAWQFLGPTNVSGRMTDVDVVAPI